MGCDGGTIPKRDELVRTKKKPEQVDLITLNQLIITKLRLRPFDYYKK